MLANRRELRRAIADRTEPCVVMVLCLDGVAGVNDMHGRAVGDAVLVEAARRLRDAVADGDVLARLDGEKFAVVTASGAIHAQLLATRLLTTLTEPYTMPTTTAYISGRVGLAELGNEPADGARADATGGQAQAGGAAGNGGSAPVRPDADEVLRRAELALRRAKRRGRGGAVEWHDPSVEAVVRRQLAIEQELPGAIGRGELELRFQPVVDLTRNRPVGTEAVVSWRHPTLGTVGSDEMLLTADDLGIGPEIAEWCLQRACRQLSAWLRDGRDLWMSLDVSAEQLAGPEFVATVDSALQTHQVPATSLVVEVAEAGLNPGSAVGRGRHTGDVDPGADARAQAIIQSLTELRSMGIRVAVDHFGTATTSFSHLRLLPVDLLKVDRVLFTEPVGGAGPATAIIDVMVKFGHQLGVVAVALGLVDETDAEVVRDAGCRYGQGDMLSRPVPADPEAHLSASAPGGSDSVTPGRRRRVPPAGRPRCTAGFRFRSRWPR
jgi:diguanylate cyclase (GGDEF)-like protein